MKRRATGLLALAAVVFAGASVFEAQYPSLGYVRATARQTAAGLAKPIEALPDEEARALVHEVVSARLRATRVAPALGKTLALVLADERHQALLNEAVRLAAEAVRDNRDVIRDKVRAESPWWVPGVVDDKIFQRIIGTVESLLRDIGADPFHPLRAAFDTALRDFVDRLQHAPDVIAKAEAMKEEWLSDPSLADLSTRLWDAMTSDRKSTRLNSSHLVISYAVFCLKKKKKRNTMTQRDS